MKDTIGLTGVAALEAEMRDRLKAKDGEQTLRIDFDKSGVDDAAIGPVPMFRIERMDGRAFWCCVYMPGDKSRHVFWIRSKSKIEVSHTFEEWD